MASTRIFIPDRSHRRRGIATRARDTSASNFIYSADLAA